MKIVVFSELYVPTLQYQENFLAKYFVKHGHDVTVVASTYESVFDYNANNYDKKVKGSERIVDGVKIIKLPYSNVTLGKIRRYSGRKVLSVLNTEKPDLILFFEVPLNLIEIARYKKRNPNSRVVMEFHSDYSNAGRTWFRLNVVHKLFRKTILNIALKHIDKIYSVVPAGFTFLHEVHGIPYEKISLLPLGADMDVFNAVKQQHKGEIIRKELGIPSDHFVIFTGGKLDSAKKTHLLIEAFLKLNHPKLHLLVVGGTRGGDSDYEKNMKKMCVGKTVHFTGWINGNEVYNYMDAADFAVFPASQSALWQQSIGMGLPLIVGSGIDGKHGDQNPSYLNVNENVIIIKRNEISADKIAENIKVLIDNTAFLETMKQGATKTAEEFLSFDILVEKITE